MIKTLSQLKALAKNLSVKNNCPHEVIYRNYMIERFLERVSVSKYNSNFILKGGMLVSSMVGNANRTTLDLDTTIKGFDTNTENLKNILEDICSIDLDDSVVFAITSIDDIIELSEYPCKRVQMRVNFEKMSMVLHIDVSTGDIITPKEIKYKYNLLLESRHIYLWSYNLETVLAEKVESILAKSVANTRMRDYYDIYILYKLKFNEIDFDIYSEALINTSKKRESYNKLCNYESIVNNIENDESMRQLWINYQNRFDYSKEIKWEDTINVLKHLCQHI